MANPTSTRLYSLLIRLRPLQRGTLMPFSGELIHGSWLNWIRDIAPEVSALVHEGNKRRYFTCSSLQFPINDEGLYNAQRKNIHLPLDPTKTYTIRLTVLRDELYQLFYHALTTFAPQTFSDTSSTRYPFMSIGKQTFLLEEIIADAN
ncbi:MAG: hypothetical protein J2P37_34150, partial [Ktedonobacteraceae bacterium]|nr:hypothetical protein [Ktedonobacteraceae bacterium]